MHGVKKVVEKINKKLGPDGFNVGWNSGSIAGQIVPHLHIHVFPRYTSDNGGSMHSIVKNPRDMKVDEVAKLIK